MFDYTKPNIMVRLLENPGMQGITTGNTRKSGTIIYVEVMYGPGDRKFEFLDALEVVESNEDLYSLLGKYRYGGPIDLRRKLIIEKVKGDLTNVFYSMEASNAEFFPHQFKPVIKFIESPYGRLLIADEVGLGKTIEAIYIWKELQVREDARRLLIVCPAMLRDKWQRDLYNLFSIDAEIVDSETLLKKASGYIDKGINKNFIYISSIEGLRPQKDYEDETKKRASSKFARMLNELSDEDKKVFDLVIIDEAHYLRNPETSNNKLGRVLRDTSGALLLLTATPVQIGSENLYNILRLIDPDQFSSVFEFWNMLEANRPIVRAQREMWKIPPDYKLIAESIQEALENQFFSSDPVLRKIHEELAEGSPFDNERRSELGRLLESRSIINQYMVRTRKRDVIENRVERKPQVLSVNFSDYELELYYKVTNLIRKQYVEDQGIASFSLVTRQRQMASCMFAAFKHWGSASTYSEILWEDFGIIEDDNRDEPDLVDGLKNVAVDFKKLEEVDSKYNALLKFIKVKLSDNQKEKFVLFSYFRGTLEYLNRRLVQDGVKTGLIMGGMDNKTEIVDIFRQESGPNILLSSEVGSEGIDLQFCHYLINYDLPWNPMRVEQRIGRLDRIGQNAEAISIINLKVEDTIEDRIIMRLYERINLFKETIGDLEEILGEMTEKLKDDLLRPDLSEEERERRAEQNAITIINKRKIQNDLEDEAANLMAFTDYIMDKINESRFKGRWLSGTDLVDFVEDFFQGNFTGTVIKSDTHNQLLKEITLSEEAKNDLDFFIRKTKPMIQTNLHQHKKKVKCMFDYQKAGVDKKDYELIVNTHPLISWIRSKHEESEKNYHSVCGISLPHSKIQSNIDLTQIKPGLYGFIIQKWEFNGIRNIKKLVYSAISVADRQIIDKESAEDLVNYAIRHGDSVIDHEEVVPNSKLIISMIQSADQLLFDDFQKFYNDFKAENENICMQQENNANKYTMRRIESFHNVIERFSAEGKESQIPRFNGLIAREKTLLKQKMDRINKKREIKHNFSVIAGGIIIVREE